MFKYLRYIIVAGLLSLFFFSQNISISKEYLDKKIEKMFPKKIEKKGLIINLNSFKINDISNNIVDSTIFATVQINPENKFLKNNKNNFFGKFIDKHKDSISKVYPLEIATKVTPIINGYYLKFKVYSLDFEIKYFKDFVLNKVKNIIENKKFEIKPLKKYSFFTSVKSIHFQDNGDLNIVIKINTFLLLFLIPLFLLREIGLLFIEIYQRWFSSKKGYKCAKGHLYGEGTCSSDTKKAFKDGGFISGMKEYRKSKKECKEAYDKITTGDVAYGGCDACSNGLLFSGRAKATAIGTGGLEATTGAVSSGAEMGAGACDVGACDVGAC